MVTTTRYLYFGNQLVGETDETGTVTRTYTNEPDDYTHPIGHTDVATGESSYYHYDGQGNTRAVTDENENVTDTFTYDSWGNLLSRTGMTNVPFQFGGEHGYYKDEELDTYYVMARVYDPSIIRWLSVDPWLYSESPLQGYTYASNNPVKFVDSSGLEKITINTGVPGEKVKSMPVYVDPALDLWTSVAALNNLCFRITAECEGPEKLKITGIDFELFITVPTHLKLRKNRSSDFLRIYGHEQKHIQTLIDAVRKQKQKELEDYLNGLENYVCDCESFITDHLFTLLPSIHEGIWKIVGPSFMHSWPGGGGNPQGPGWGEPVRNDGIPKTVPKTKGEFQERDDVDLPADGVDGWFCPMDQVLKGTRKWPDFEFAPPDAIIPFEPPKKKM